MTKKKWPKRKIVSWTMYVGYGDEGIRRLNKIRQELAKRGLSLSHFALETMEKELGINHIQRRNNATPQASPAS